MIMTRLLCVMIASIGLWASLPLSADPASAQTDGVPTKIMVRALSRDAKIIGSNVGGARITIRDVHTGAILAQGIQEGQTGDTKLIMAPSRERGAKIFDTPGTAGFLATVMLERPTTVEITAEGPLAAPENLQKASKTLLLVPGQDVLGEGIILEIHGYIIKLLAPADGDRFTVGQEATIKIALNMT
jgi:hypothetical protein